jgi:hypothetical protein
MVTAHQTPPVLTGEDSAGRACYVSRLGGAMNERLKRHTDCNGQAAGGQAAPLEGVEV